MKRSFASILFSIALLASCKNDDPQPTAYESLAKLLAGEKGKSKAWKLVTETKQMNGGVISPVSLPTCFLDNNYVFSNNDSQTYALNEGATKCDSTDPDAVESGNWSFTANGKIFIVIANTYTYSDSHAPNGLFLFLPFPSEVVTLTDTGMVAKMTINENTNVYVFTFTFAKA